MDRPWTSDYLVSEQARRRWEADAIRRGWLYPREPIRYEDVPQRFPRDPSIVTFKDWLDAREPAEIPPVDGPHLDTLDAALLLAAMRWESASN